MAIKLSAEAKVLTAVLKDKQLHVLLQSGADKMFRSHLDVWEFIRSYSEKFGALPDIELVQDKFRDFVPAQSVGATKYHLDELRQDFLDDSLRSVLRSAAADLKAGQTQEALNELINKTAELIRSTSVLRDIDAVDIDSALEHFELVKEMANLGSLGIKTGLAGFDNYLPAGIAPGQFGLFLAYPQIGKSWLGLFFAVAAWRLGRTPLVISLEMSEPEVRNRVYAIMGQGRWSHRKLSAGEVDIDEFKRWAEKELANKPPFHIISLDAGGGDFTPSVVRGKIDQYAPDIVFVDYLQLMQSNIPTDNETVKIKSISRDLKLLAISENVPIVAIASATPDDISDSSSPPQLMQVAWAKQLAYDSDWVLALGRQPNSDIIECVFRKNRNGYQGEFLIQAEFDSGRFIYKDFEDS